MPWVRRKYLRDLIEQQGRTQQEVAREAGLHHNTVNYIIRGTNRNPTFDTLAKIARVLEIPVTDLIEPE
jgi:transcriptional regulator with XRE-family HTH domain